MTPTAFNKKCRLVINAAKNIYREKTPYFSFILENGKKKKLIKNSPKLQCKSEKWLQLELARKIVPGYYPLIEYKRNDLYYCQRTSAKQSASQLIHPEEAKPDESGGFSVELKEWTTSKNMSNDLEAIKKDIKNPGRKIARVANPVLGLVFIRSDDPKYFKSILQTLRKGTNIYGVYSHQLRGDSRGNRLLVWRYHPTHRGQNRRQSN